MKEDRQCSKPPLRRNKSNLSEALLSKNPSEENSLSKKLEQIEKLRNRVIRETDASISDFAIQHLHVVKYYDAKNGKQYGRPSKQPRVKGFSLPSLTCKELSRKKQSPCENSLKRSRDYITPKPRYGRSLRHMETASTTNLFSNDTLLMSVQEIPNEEKDAGSKYLLNSWGQRNLASSLPPRTVKLCEKTEKRHGSRLNTGTETKTVGESNIFESPKDRFCTKNDGVFFQERSGRKLFQRRQTVATNSPAVEDLGRWQYTIRRVKDLPKSEQAEILKGVRLLGNSMIACRAEVAHGRRRMSIT